MKFKHKLTNLCGRIVSIFANVARTPVKKASSMKTIVPWDQFGLNSHFRANDDNFFSLIFSVRFIVKIFKNHRKQNF